MNRDPDGYDCTRDPIYLFQVGRRQWTQIPDGLESDCDGGFEVTDRDLLPEWVDQFLDDDEELYTSEEFYTEAEKHENDNNWPFVVIEWSTELVFLTRAEANRYGESKSYRYEKWRVYCVPCQGELAKILDGHHNVIA